MRPTSRWGITLPLSGMPLTGQRDLVAALPDLGYTDAWSSEVNGHDAFTPLALAAQWTSKQETSTPGTDPAEPAWAGVACGWAPPWPTSTPAGRPCWP